MKRTIVGILKYQHAPAGAHDLLALAAVYFAVELHQIESVVAAHVHSGAAGANGPVRVDFFLGPATGAVNGRLVEGSFTAADVRGVTFETLLEQMRTGAAYVNVHTTRYPGGEVRGQTQLVQ